MLRLGCVFDAEAQLGPPKDHGLPQLPPSRLGSEAGLLPTAFSLREAASGTDEAEHGLEFGKHLSAGVRGFAAPEHLPQ